MLRANSGPIYHVIRVRMLALVVDRIGYARQIFTVLLYTERKRWDRAPISRGMTRGVLSLSVSFLSDLCIL